MKMNFDGIDINVDLTLPPNRVVIDGKCYELTEINEIKEERVALREKEKESERAIKSLKLMKERFEEKCTEVDELKRHCEQLAYMSFKRQCVIDELVGMGDEE